MRAIDVPDPAAALRCAVATPKPPVRAMAEAAPETVRAKPGDPELPLVRSMPLLGEAPACP